MANPIQNNQVASQDAFKNLTDGGKELLGLLDKLTEETKRFGKEAEGVAKSFNFSKSEDIAKINTLLEQLVKNTEKVTTAQKQRKQVEDALTKEQKERIQIEQKLTAAIRAEGSETEKLKATLNEQRRVNRDLAKDQSILSNTYKGQSRILNNLRNKYKDLAVQNKENTREGRKLLRTITTLDERLKRVDKSVGQNQRNVGNYSSAFKGLVGNLLSTIGLAGGVAGAIAGISAAVRASITLFTDFGLATAKVKAISGATNEEFEVLKGNAKALGETTQFTATEVAGLQLELSKLGFDPKQINDSTEAILNFAIATDSDLARAGEVVAQVLNQFNLEASEAGRIADVAAKAFSSSALDIEKFQSAIAGVGPAANAVGVSIERTTAILAKIVDSGVDASKAGTDLRNIFIELADQGLTYEEALDKIQNSQNSLLTANELFNKRGSVTGTILANNRDEVDKLEQSFLKAGGSAKAASDIIGDTLNGDIKRLQSAIEGATLGNEEFEGTIRKVVQFLTKALPPVINFIGKLFNLIVSAVKPVVSAIVSLGRAWREVLIELGLFGPEASIYVSLLKAIGDALKPVAVFIQIIAKGLRLLAKELREFSDDKLNGFLKAATNGFIDLNREIKKTGESVKKVGDNVEQLKNTEKILSAFSDFASAAFDKVKKSANSLADTVKESDLFQFLQKLGREISRAVALDNATKAIQNRKLSVEELNEAIKEQEEILKGVREGERGVAIAIQETIRLLEERKKAILGEKGRGKSETEQQKAERINAKKLAADLLKIEQDLNAGIEKVLAQRGKTEEQRAEEINRLKEKAALERNEAELVRLQQLFDEISAIEGDKTKDQIDRSKEIQEKLTEIAEEGLDDRLKAERDAIAEETKLREDKLESDREFGEKKKEAEELAIKQLEESAQRSIAAIEKFSQDTSQKNIDGINQEIEAINRREDALRNAIENGSELGEKSLTLLDEQRQEQEDKREKELEKQARREVFIAAARLLADSGSLAGAAQNIAGLKAIVDRVLGGFHDGGYTGDGGEWSTAGIVHKGEFVNTARQVDNYGMRGWEASDFDRAVKSGYFSQFTTPEYLQYDQVRPVVNTTFDQSQVINRLERVEDAILMSIDKNPKHNKQWDEEAKEMVYILETKNRIDKQRRKFKGY